MTTAQYVSDLVDMDVDFQKIALALMTDSIEEFYNKVMGL